MDAASSRLPEGLLLAYYGDDFTGSTDVLEAFTAAGVETVLFLRPPEAGDLAHFPDARCVGLAGLSRGRDPAWMQQHLPQAFERLSALGAPILQYKVCSTFDSSPAIGSIGQAIDLGVRCCQGDWSPVIVGAPRLRRFQVFGHLFAAASDGQVYRIDRHPTMSRHPVTPMDESDLRLHLGRQTARPISGIDLAQLAAGQGAAQIDALRNRTVPVVMIDVADTATQLEAGRLVWEGRGAGLFSASSSGLQYALAAWWRHCGWLPAQPSLPAGRPVSRMAAVSGSCSPVSAQQIEAAAQAGFHLQALDVAASLTGQGGAAQVERQVQAAVKVLRAGGSPLIHSALGPDDPRVTGFDDCASRAGMSRTQGAERIGQVLADIMRGILETEPLERVVVAGGDSAGAVASRLGIDALTVSAALAPGVPMCRAWSSRGTARSLEIALKGGQLGGLHFYRNARDGRDSAAD